MQFGELTKNLLLMGIGAAATTAEKSKDLVDELVKKGEITIDQGKVLNEELKNKASDKVSESMLKRVDKMSKEQRDALRAKLKEMDQDDANEDAVDAEVVDK